jgi:iron donor protein CyaY
MLEKDFLKFCEDTLLSLAQSLEEQDKNSKFDVEYSDGILEIVVLSTKQTYVINRNSGNQKIWYSSPISGADYFSFDEKSKTWLNASGIDLDRKLFSELTKL